VRTPKKNESFLRKVLGKIFPPNNFFYALVITNPTSIMEEAPNMNELPMITADDELPIGQPELVRGDATHWYPDEEDPPGQELIDMYLQYTCQYEACKYKGSNDITWGCMVTEDYGHFVYLMANHVPLKSHTYKVLRTQLGPEDQKYCDAQPRETESEEYKKKQLDKFLDLHCSHNGRMHGKQWREIRNKHYPYFVWAVGNTMGRLTKTFDVLSRGLQPEDLKMVMDTPKGKVVKKGSKYRRRSYNIFTRPVSPVAA
jgi:hypothetical protein